MLDALSGKHLTPRVGDVMRIELGGTKAFEYRIAGFAPCNVERRFHPTPNLSSDEADHLHFLNAQWKTNRGLPGRLLSVTLLVRGRGKRMQVVEE